MSGTVDIDADCINTWLQSTIKWNAGQELRSFSKTETANFLHSLREKLKQLFSRNGSLLDVLESCPNVGQLLGRMCGNSLILSDRQLYRALITCVLLFNVDSPQMALEVKAKQWALAQVRSTVSFSVGDMKSTLMSSVGFRQQELWEELLAQVLKDVTKLLTVPLRKWSSENNYFLPVSVPARLTGPMLHRVLSVTSSMPVTPALSALVGEIVKWVCHTQGDDPRLQQFMEDITIKTSCTFNSSYTDHILPVEGRSVLWTSYIP
ncbi:uncharacterized protein LOC106168718, partial [Lingula anatina]|uniref:Uncharacterized protein LOC106168718 n=1 Tax=Lingula anatina TaxID=7574 RepID=A0A1S3IZ97_LINAN